MTMKDTHITLPNLLLEAFVLIAVVAMSNNFFDRDGSGGIVFAFAAEAAEDATTDESRTRTRPDQVVFEDQDDNGRYYGDNYDPSSWTKPNKNVVFPTSSVDRNICSVCMDPLSDEDLSSSPSKTTTFRIGQPDRIIPFVAAVNNTCQNVDDMLRSYEQMMTKEACDVARKLSFGDFLDPASFCLCGVDNSNDDNNSGETVFIEPPMSCPFCTIDTMSDPDWIIFKDENKSNDHNTTFTCRDAAEIAPYISDESYCVDVYTSWRRGCCYEFYDNDTQSRCSICDNDRNEKVMYPNNTVVIGDKDVKRCGDIEMEIGFLVGDECSDFLSNATSLDLENNCGCSNATEDQRGEESRDGQGYDVTSMDTIWLAPIVFIIGSCFYVCLKKLDSIYNDGPDLPSERWRQQNQMHDDSSIDNDNDNDNDDATGIMHYSVTSFDTRSTRNRSSRLFQTP